MKHLAFWLCLLPGAALAHVAPGESIASLHGVCAVDMALSTPITPPPLCVQDQVTGCAGS